MIYYVTLATIFFCGFFIDKHKAKRYLVISFILLWVFTAFRDISVGGTDVRSYSNFFDNVVPTLSDIKTYGSEVSEFEIGYMIMNSIVKTMGGDFLSFQILYTTISLLLMYMVIELTGLEDNEKCLFLFIYFTFRYFLNAMGLLRQNIANEIIWIGFLAGAQPQSKIKNNKLRTVLEYLWFYISFYFHRSAIFNLLFVPVVKKIKRFDKIKLTVGVAIISVICIGLSGPVVNRFINIAISVGGSRYEKYLISGEATVKGFNPINYILRWVFLLMFLIQYKTLKYDKKDTVFVIGCLAVICGSINVEIFTRMLEYYMIGFYIMMTLSYRNFEGKWRYAYYILIYFAFIIILVRNLHTTSGGLYLNYKFTKGI